MARGPNITLEAFGCYSCGRRLGWTAEGEAKRMNTRARLYCDVCKDTPADGPASLTERQRQVLDALRAMTERGERANISAAARQLGMSVSRAQQIVTAIRGRGMGSLVDEALGKAPATASSTPHTTAPASPPVGVVPAYDPAHHVAAAAEGVPSVPPSNAPAFVNPDGSPTSAPVFTPPAGVSNPTTSDPASTGAEFA